MWAHVSAGGRCLQDGAAEAGDKHARAAPFAQQRALARRQHHLSPAHPDDTLLSPRIDAVTCSRPGLAIQILHVYTQPNDMPAHQHGHPFGHRPIDPYCLPFIQPAMLPHPEV